MRFSEFRLLENDPAVDAETDDAVAAGLQAGPPYPPKQEAAVKALQTKLQELGYSVGNTGIDGKYGPRTSRAVAAFMRDNNITSSDSGRSIESDDLAKLQTAQRVPNPTPTGNERQGGGSASRSFNADELAALDFGGADNARAKAAAEEYLGSSISDSHWNMLVRATVAEASPNQEERAAVMAVILNRVRENFGSYGSSIPAQLSARNQFQAVTGTRYDPGPSRNFTNPGRQAVAGTAQAAIDLLANSNRTWMNFTASDPRAYGPGTNIGFRQTVAQSPGSRRIGGTIFGTV
jgi:peptidoglycan hydrolase-like protein with peptidoglycan-binding domain